MTIVFGTSCYENKYGSSYSTIEEATVACNLDSNCHGINDYKCEGSQLYLCPFGTKYAEANRGSCTHQKPGKNFGLRSGIFGALKVSFDSTW